MSAVPNVFFDGYDNVLGAGDSVSVYNAYLARITNHLNDPNYSEFLIDAEVNFSGSTSSGAITVDVEDGDVAEVTISKPLLDRYKANLQAFCLSLKEFCTRRGIHYLFTGTDVEFDHLVLTYLRQRGLLA